MSKNFFDKQSYYRRGENLPIDYHVFSPARKYEFKKFLDFLKPKKNAKLVELGSGYGKFVLPLLKLGHSVTAIDISKNSLRILYKEAKKNNVAKHLTIIQSNFKESSLVDLFDAGFCISSLHLLSKNENEKVVIMKNFVKSIKPGAKLVVIQPNPLNPLFYPFYLWHRDVSWETEKYFMKVTENYLKGLFSSLGLEQIKVKYVGFFPMRLIHYVKAIRMVNEFINTLPFFNKFSSFIYIEGKKSFK